MVSVMPRSVFPNSLALRDYCITKGRIEDLNLAGIKPERVAMVIGGLSIPYRFVPRIEYRDAN